jgi:hypothetical protein
MLLMICACVIRLGGIGVAHVSLCRPNGNQLQGVHSNKASSAKDELTVGRGQVLPWRRMGPPAHAVCECCSGPPLTGEWYSPGVWGPPLWTSSV